MIDRILDLSKIEAGLKRYSPEVVDPAALIEGTLANFAHVFEKSAFSVERRIEAGLPPVRVDPQAFTQALSNLLSNAVKYSENDRRITVGARRRDRWFEVSVTDRGIGIPRSEQRRIFDRFYRSRGAAAKAQGAGLGLALVRHFAAAHGGEVTVASAPGKGSSFAIRLPLAAENDGHAGGR
jgi:signal transduction histidine kinase